MLFLLPFFKYLKFKNYIFPPVPEFSAEIARGLDASNDVAQHLYNFQSSYVTFLILNS